MSFTVASHALAFGEFNVSAKEQKSIEVKLKLRVEKGGELK